MNRRDRNAFQRRLTVPTSAQPNPGVPQAEETGEQALPALSPTPSVYGPHRRLDGKDEPAALAAVPLAMMLRGVKVAGARPVGH